MTMVRKILVFGMALSLLTAGLAYGADPIKIGSVLRLSVGAEHGIPSRRGVEMAVAEVNKAGGINGRQVQAHCRGRERLSRGRGERGAETHQRGQGGGHRRPHDLRRHDGRGQNRQ